MFPETTRVGKPALRSSGLHQLRVSTKAQTISHLSRLVDEIPAALAGLVFQPFPGGRRRLQRSQERYPRDIQSGSSVVSIGLDW